MRGAAIRGRAVSLPPPNADRVITLPPPGRESPPGTSRGGPPSGMCECDRSNSFVARASETSLTGEIRLQQKKNGSSHKGRERGQRSPRAFHAKAAARSGQSREQRRLKFLVAGGTGNMLICVLTATDMRGKVIDASSSSPWCRRAHFRPTKLVKLWKIVQEKRSSRPCTWSPSVEFADWPS
jgi:hypothetical protein